MVGLLCYYQDNEGIADGYYIDFETTGFWWDDDGENVIWVIEDADNYRLTEEVWEW